MNRLARYVLFETLKVFVLTLAGMTFLMIIGVLAKEALQKGLGPLPILKMIPFVLPDALRFAVPGTMLFAACSVYGRMSADNELVAVKSLGISPLAVILPVLVLSFLVSLVAVWLNDVAVSWGRRGIQRVFLESVEQIAYGMLRTQRSYSTRHFSINVKSVEGRKLERVHLTIRRGGDTPPVILSAAEAELRSDAEQNRLIIMLTDGSIDVGDDVSISFPDTIQHEIPLTDAADGEGDLQSPSDCPYSRLKQERKQQQEQIDRIGQSLAAQAAFQLFTGDYARLTDAPWRQQESTLERAQGRLFRLNTEPFRRWATGFSCLFFVLVGAPWAIRMRNADVWTTFGVCFFPILIVYYPLLMSGVERAKCGALPPYSVWLGNIVLSVVGIWQLRKVVRY